MKTLIRNIKFGALIIGMSLLFSCSSSPVEVSAIGIGTVTRTLPLMAKAAKKYTGNKLSKYLKSSSATKTGSAPSNRKKSEPGKTVRVMPISIGMVGEFQLASAIDRSL